MDSREIFDQSLDPHRQTQTQPLERSLTTLRYQCHSRELGPLLVFQVRKTASAFIEHPKYAFKIAGKL